MDLAKETKMTFPLEVGRKIYYTGDMANPSGTGAICAVTPIANPLKSYSLGTGRMVENDNSVRYDVVLNDGRMMKQLPAFLFDPQTCGQRFQPRDGAETADEVAAMVDNANVYAATKNAEAVAKANAFERAKAAARVAGIALGLTPEAEFKGRGRAAVADTIARQRDALTGKNRSLSAREVARERAARGERPAFMKGERS